MTQQTERNLDIVEELSVGEVFLVMDKEKGTSCLYEKMPDSDDLFDSPNFTRIAGDPEMRTYATVSYTNLVVYKPCETNFLVKEESLFHAKLSGDWSPVHQDIMAHRKRYYDVYVLDTHNAWQESRKQ